MRMRPHPELPLYDIFNLSFDCCYSCSITCTKSGAPTSSDYCWEVSFNHTPPSHCTQGRHQQWGISRGCKRLMVELQVSWHQSSPELRNAWPGPDPVLSPGGVLAGQHVPGCSYNSSFCCSGREATRYWRFRSASLGWPGAQHSIVNSTPARPVLHSMLINSLGYTPILLATCTPSASLRMTNTVGFTRVSYHTTPLSSPRLLLPLGDNPGPSERHCYLQRGWTSLLFYVFLPPLPPTL